jgi:hypothetical protein
MSNGSEDHQIEKAAFPQRYRLTEEAFQKAGLEWSLLEQI